jgi:hypothetical protein
LRIENTTTEFFPAFSGSEHRRYVIYLKTAGSGGVI